MKRGSPRRGARLPRPVRPHTGGRPVGEGKVIPERGVGEGGFVGWNGRGEGSGSRAHAPEGDAKRTHGAGGRKGATPAAGGKAWVRARVWEVVRLVLARSVWYVVGLFVISTAVILNGGQIYIAYGVST